MDSKRAAEILRDAARPEYGVTMDEHRAADMGAEALELLAFVEQHRPDIWSIYLNRWKCYAKSIAAVVYGDTFIEMLRNAKREAEKNG